MALEKWFIAPVKKWPIGKSFPDERTDLIAAKKYFQKGFLRDDLRNARRAKTPLQWHKQGMRPLKREIPYPYKQTVCTLGAKDEE